MTLPRPQPAMPGSFAWFFDVDGTLVDIAPTPDAVQVADAVPRVLARLRDLGLAIAIVSGRPIEQIDRLLAPLRLPAAGVHGAERRDARGQIHRTPVPDLSAAIELARHACADLGSGVNLELKPAALVLHYRQAPARAADCLAWMRRIATQVDGMAIQQGKMLVELKPAAADKGRAVQAFLREPPFRGRQPWYFGDDLSDEHAFEAVQAVGGAAVKLGPGPSVAIWRIPDPAALHRWLDDAADTLARTPRGRPRGEASARRNPEAAR